jgi:hypothetical protein
MVFVQKTVGLKLQNLHIIAQHLQYQQVVQDIKTDNTPEPVRIAK